MSPENEQARGNGSPARYDNEEANMSERTPRLSRRNFLLTIGAGSTAAAAGLVTQKPQSAVAPDKSKRGTAGYQESAHVRNYYRTTKV